jgi:hypothetical protein
MIQVWILLRTVSPIQEESDTRALTTDAESWSGGDLDACCGSSEVWDLRVREGLKFGCLWDEHNRCGLCYDTDKAEKLPCWEIN